MSTYPSSSKLLDYTKNHTHSTMPSNTPCIIRMLYDVRRTLYGTDQLFIPATTIFSADRVIPPSAQGSCLDLDLDPTGGFESEVVGDI